MTLMWRAAFHGDLETLRHWREQLTATHLWWAAYMGHVSATRFIAGVVGPDAPNEYGRTAFQAALLRRHPAIISLLLEMGADPSAGYWGDLTPYAI